MNIIESSVKSITIWSLQTLQWAGQNIWLIVVIGVLFVVLAVTSKKWAPLLFSKH